MLEYHRDLGYPVICFTEGHLVKYLPDFVLPYVIEYDDLPTHRLVAKTGIGYSNAMNDGILHEGHRLYSIVTNSKIFFMSFLNGYDTYIWLDSGIEHGDPVTTSIAKETLEDISSDERSRLNLINYPTTVNLGINMYNVSSNLFSIKSTSMTLILSEYTKILEHVRDNGYICLEEQIFALVYLEIPSTFSVRFTDYRALSNGGKYIRCDVGVIMRNIDIVPTNMRDSLVHMFLDSLSTGNLRLSPDELLYYIYKLANYSEVIRRIIYHILKYKSYENDPKYKGRYDMVSKIKEYGTNVTCEKKFNSFYEYLKEFPYDRTIIRTMF
jgi:hypothetical protein